jgi:drug/metabolite transporter (DMT)-like permease
MDTSTTTRSTHDIRNAHDTQNTANRRTSRSLILLGFLAIVLIWGSFPIAAKIGVTEVPPLLLSSTRFLLASLLLAPIALMQRKRLRLTLKQHIQVCLVSLFMIAIPSVIFFLAAPYGSIGVLTLMWSTTPLFTALFNLGGQNEAHGWRLALSLCVGLVGIVIVLIGRIPFLFGAGGTDLNLFAGNRVALLGELAVLASAGIYGFGLKLAKQNNPDLPVITLTMWQMFYTGTLVGLCSLLFERGYTLHPTLSSIGILLYLAIFCGCITFFLTFWLIRRIGAIRTSYSDFIIPGVTLILSYFFLGESLTIAKISGFALVMLGCFLVQGQ